MSQKHPVIKSIEEALHYVGSQTGGYKRLCCAICPELADEPDEAQRKVARKLSKTAKEVWSDKDTDVAIEWGRKHDCHVLKWWKDEIQNYERSTPKHAKSELVILLEDRARLTTELAENHAREEEINSAAATAISSSDIELVK